MKKRSMGLCFILLFSQVLHAETFNFLKPNDNYNSPTFSEGFLKRINDTGILLPAQNLRLTVPESVINGASIPVTVELKSRENIDTGSLWLFAEGNPSPTVAYIQFHKKQSVYRFSTRIKMQKSAKLHAIFVGSKGNSPIFLNTKAVDVVISGIPLPNYCKEVELTKEVMDKNNPDNKPKIEVYKKQYCGKKESSLEKTIRAKARFIKENSSMPQSMLAIKALITNEMLPLNVITKVEAKVDDQLMATIHLSSNVSKNPFIEFNTNGKLGSSVSLKVMNVTAATDQIKIKAE